MLTFKQFLSFLFLGLLSRATVVVNVQRHLGGDDCTPVDSKTAYKYQQLALGYLTNVDDIANVAEDAEEWYYDVIAPYQSHGIDWRIEAGPRILTLKGTEEVKGLFVNLSTRDFAFHQWSHWRACEGNNDNVRVFTRYHGVVREPEAVNQDIFGGAEVVFSTQGKRKDLITDVTVIRTETIDRPY